MNFESQSATVRPVSSYDLDFFAGQIDGSRSSASVISSLISGLLKPKSVVDVGCGTGAWLAAFKETGVERVLGLDGDYVAEEVLLIDRDDFRPTDLASDWSVDGRFDLAISMEVAEHLPPAVGPNFVERLTSLAPAVLFSAAIPLQGGTDHRNERAQSYWASLFEARGYSAIDAVRPRVWNDVRVEPWYAQNALLYVDDSVAISEAGPSVVDVVHPRLLELNRTAPLSLSEVKRRFPASVAHARSTIRRRVRSNSGTAH